MWKPDNSRVEALRRQRGDLLRGLDSVDGRNNRSVTLQLLETVGELSFLGDGDVAGTVGEDAIARALASFDPDSLSEAAENAVMSSDDLADREGAHHGERAQAVLEAVSVRTRAELILEGAHVLLGRSPSIPEDLHAALLAFDDVVRPELWRQIPINERRAAAILAYAPQNRARFWWLHRGADLPEDTLETLGVVARLIHMFPEVRQELDRLISAERDLDSMRASKPESVFVSLTEHFERRRARAAASRTEKPAAGVIRFAAADISTETVIFERPEVTLSLTRYQFIVDLERPARPDTGSAVRLEAEGQPPLDGRPTERGRFEFSLDAAQLRASKATLRLDLADGSVVIPLPLDDD